MSKLHGTRTIICIALCLLCSSVMTAYAQEVAPATPAAPATQESAPAPSEAKKAPEAPVNFDELSFNFQNVPITTVLDYLSKAGGFIIVRDTEITGRITVVSHQPVSRNEAIVLLNTILNDKGYAVIRNERVLTIVSRSDARFLDIPVKTGSDPAGIPKTGEMVVQIIPVRYGNASQLIQNLTPLLPENASLTYNASSNALVLTDTQSNIRRMTEIIAALDSAISDVSTMKVYEIKHSDAATVADIINTLFNSQTSGRSSGQGAGGMMPVFGGPGFGVPGGGNQGGPSMKGRG